MPAVQAPIFVYGTLRHGQGNYHWALEGRTQAEYSAVLAGHAIYRAPHGGFPYLTAAHPESAVMGELMVIHPDSYAQVLANLDRLEGYRSGSAESHYQRMCRQVTYHHPHSGQQQAVAWVYLAGPDAVARLATAQPIPGGDWLAHPGSC